MAEVFGFLYLKSINHDVITIYIAKDSPIQKTIDLLKREEPLVQNIKSRTTRQSIEEAFQKIKSFLNKLPPSDNGYIVVASAEGFAWTNEVPVIHNDYKCGNEFYSKPLEDALTSRLNPIGILTLDTKEATLGFVGSGIEILKHMTSGISGKHAKGGQCLSKDSVVLESSGEIVHLEKVKKGTLIKGIDFSTSQIINTEVLNVHKEINKAFRIRTKAPSLELDVSGNHVVFIYEKGKIVEKKVEDLQSGNLVLLIGKLDYSNLDDNLRKEEAQLLGYFLGDGNFDKNRIVFSEGNKELALKYQNLIEEVFRTKPKLQFRTAKNYFEIRIYSKKINEKFRDYFKGEKNHFPEEILHSSESILASFLKGLFDAEGFMDSSGVGLTMKNKFLVLQIQMSLLRLGIISSFRRKTSKSPFIIQEQFNLNISNKKYLSLFSALIGFSREDKRISLDKLLEKKSSRSYIRKKLEFLNSKIIPVEIWKITSLKNLELIDLTTSCGNFICNGVIVHNSQRRFEREREQEILAFFARVGEATKVYLNPEYEITELVLCGCGDTKKDFLKTDYMDYRIKQKVKIVLDTQYTGEEGIREALNLALPELQKNAFANEVRTLDFAFELLGKDIDRIVYGNDEIRKNIRHIGKLFKLEEITIGEDILKDFKGELVNIRFKGEHSEKLKGLGGIIGVLQ